MGHREELPHLGLAPLLLVWTRWVEVDMGDYSGLLPAPHDFFVPAVRLHDSISEEGFHYLVFDL